MLRCILQSMRVFFRGVGVHCAPGSVRVPEPYGSLSSGIGSRPGIFFSRASLLAGIPPLSAFDHQGLPLSCSFDDVQCIPVTSRSRDAFSSSASVQKV